MSDLFLELLNLSIMAGWLILAVLVVRVCLKKAPKYIRCILWGLVGLRLILPFSIESIFSLLPSGKVIDTEIVYDRTPAINSGIPVIDDVTNNLMMDSFAPDMQNSVNPLQVVTFIASNVWILGVVLMLIYCIVSCFLVRRKVFDAVKREGNIYECERVATPFVFGVVKPKIYIPYQIDDAAREYVVAHEKAHIKRGDHISKLVGFLVLSVYWFNPLVWVAYILLCKDIELACDEKVLKSIGEVEKKKYSRVLLQYSVSPKMVAACPLAFGEVAVGQRIKNVLNYKKPAFWIIIVSVVVCGVVAACFMTSPKEDAVDKESGNGIVPNETVKDSEKGNADEADTQPNATMGTAPTENEERLLLRVDDKLYYCSGLEAEAVAKCGVMDGTIETRVEKGEIPTENNQSNFGTGYGWQRTSLYEIEVFMPYDSLENKWIRFVEEGKTVGETEFDENTVLVDVDQIFSITMVNGNTGEEIETSRLMSDNTMNNLIDLYKKLEFQPQDTVYTEAELRVGWQYCMRLYDVDGNLLQIVTPYDDTVELDSIIYDSSMNYSSYLLLRYMDQKFHPVENLAGVYATLDSVDGNGFAFTIRNETDKEVHYGEAYVLWVKENDKWEKVPTIIEKYGFNAIAYIVPAYGVGGSMRDWTWLYGTLEEGKRYKITMEISSKDENEKWTAYELSYEFIL